MHSSVHRPVSLCIGVKQLHRLYRPHKDCSLQSTTQLQFTYSELYFIWMHFGLWCTFYTNNHPNNSHSAKRCRIMEILCNRETILSLSFNPKHHDITVFFLYFRQELFWHPLLFLIFTHPKTLLSQQSLLIAVVSLMQPRLTHAMYALCNLRNSRSKQYENAAMFQEQNATN